MAINVSVQYNFGFLHDIINYIVYSPLISKTSEESTIFAQIHATVYLPWRRGLLLWGKIPFFPFASSGPWS